MLRKPTAPFLIGHIELARMLAISVADALFLCEVNAIPNTPIGKTKRFRILESHVELFITNVHTPGFGGILNTKTKQWIFPPQPQQLCVYNTNQQQTEQRTTKATTTITTSGETIPASVNAYIEEILSRNSITTF